MVSNSCPRLNRTPAGTSSASSIIPYEPEPRGEFPSFEHVPQGLTIYSHAMDIQAWQYKHGLRVFCLPCIRGRQIHEACKCRLVDSTGTLTAPGDSIMFPHTEATQRYYRCQHRRYVTRRGANEWPKACNLQVMGLWPVIPIRTGSSSLA